MGKSKKKPFSALKIAIFGMIFGFMSIFSTFFLNSAYAVPAATSPESSESTDETIDGSTSGTTTESESDSSASCTDSLGAIGWLVCPTTGKIAEAVDWLYNTIEDILIINPLDMSDSSPTYTIWRIVLGFSNIVFVIFLLVVIISQVTGLGINNYGIKRALPKLIVAAIFVNLSFIICEVGIEVSNIVGSGLRDIFTSVEETSLASSNVGEAAHVSYTDYYSALAGGTALTIGGVIIAVESGLIWMLIPTVLAALVAVVTGLITVALRQAVVVLLVIISPLAMVAYILPNTEHLYKKWRGLLIQMLVFYPMFSLLFGASSLAGWALIVSANNGLGVLLGIAVQVFPLFFSWQLMRMSGTVLGRINQGLRALAARPLGRNRGWAASHAALSRSNTLSRPNPYTPSAHLMQFLNKRAVDRKMSTDENMGFALKSGENYHNTRYYRDGDIVKAVPNARYEKLLRKQSRDLLYQTNSALHRDNLEDFPNTTPLGAGERARYDAIGGTMASRADALYAANSKLSYIQYKNARGRQERFQAALYSNIDRGTTDESKWHKTQYALGGLDENGQKSAKRLAAESRYDMLKDIMGGDQEFEYTAADAAVAFGSEASGVQKKMTAYTSLIPASVDIEQQVRTFAAAKNSNEHFDAILGGLKTINAHGDTDIVLSTIEDAIIDPASKKSKIELGTYASQSLASFCMSEVKDSDPLIRRFGKYINIETARVFNPDPAKRRTNKNLTFNEYITGEYQEVDENGEPIYDIVDGESVPRMGHSKRNAASLLAGTSFKGVERTAFGNLTSAAREAATKPDGTLDLEKFEKLQEGIWKSIAPNLTGDQFSFLSGSEQIKSLASYITGMKGDEIDWEGIFGSHAAELTDEQKAAYALNSAAAGGEDSFLAKRVKSFLGGQVANQILRAKSDMFNPEVAFFENQVKHEHPDWNADEIKAEVKKRLQASLDETSYESATISYGKGMQNDTKPKVADYLDFEGHWQKLVDEGKITASGKRLHKGATPESAGEPDDHSDDVLPVEPTADSPIDAAVDATIDSDLSDLDNLYNHNRHHDSNSPSDLNSFYNLVIASGLVSDEKRSAFDNELGDPTGYSSVTDLYQTIRDILAHL